MERIVTAYEDKNCNYENSMWKDFIEYINSLLRQEESTATSNRIAELFNASVKLTERGLRPGNKVQNYVLRKIMRMSFELCEENNIESDRVLDYLDHNNDEVAKVHEEEKIRYQKTIDRGMKSVKKLIKKSKGNVDYERLKATYGLNSRHISSLLSEISEEKELEKE